MLFLFPRIMLVKCGSITYSIGIFKVGETLWITATENSIFLRHFGEHSITTIKSNAHN